MLCCLQDADLHQELENFRLAYEAEHGETDLTKRYTSTWPTAQQEWLCRTYPKRYWDGLPPFVQCFFTAKMELAAQSGELDEMPPEMIGVFIRNRMRRDDNSRER